MKLFIHGLGSCGWGAKSLAMRRHFGVANLLAPDLPFTPTNVIARLKDLVTRYPVSTLIGSSLGGFYATAINREFGLPAILINPVVYPHRLLADYRGEQRRWCDDAPFRINDDYVRALAGLQRDELGDDERYLVLLQRGDEVLDYRQAADYYAGKDVVILAGGSHRFDDIERVLPTIDTWLEQTP